MSENPQSPSWWQLHLRKARGEILSDAEEQEHAAEMARHDAADTLSVDLTELLTLRKSMTDLAQENDRLRQRVRELGKMLRLCSNFEWKSEEL
jgi:hypothetical protein